MNSRGLVIMSRKFTPSTKQVERGYPSHWEVHRFLIKDDFTYSAAVVPVSEKSVGVWAILYGLIGLLTGILVFARAGEGHAVPFLIYLASANIAAFGLKLTSIKRGLPFGFLFLLLGIEDLSLPELLFIALSITLLRDEKTVRRLSDVTGLLYNIATVTIGVVAAQSTYQLWAVEMAGNAIFPAPIIASAFVLMANCALSALLLTRGQEQCLDTYRTECRPLFLWFVATGYFAYLVQCTAYRTGYHSALIALPLLFILDGGYRNWCNTLTQRKEEVAQLHRNTLETLALAIEARDQTTHLHLRRVQTYALAIGRELKLSEAELEALNVAALLHDIGKLGIPDHILLKPGPLTSPEWEKMKTHAMIGATMLSRMHFPDLVSDIVRTHHEKWDGTGYPNGLKGANIPIGSRILSAVDCLDALASDRPYRSALPLEEAMAMVRGQDNKSFDPAVIAILERRYMELDQLARESVGDIGVNRGAISSSPAPQQSITSLATRLLTESRAAVNENILNPIISARQETQLLLELASDLAQSARLDEVVSAIHKCLSQKIGYDTFGIYVRRQAVLDPIYFLGTHAHLFTKNAFPITEGLSGWIAQYGSPVLNGNASVEACYSNDSMVLNNLQTALGVPFESRGGMTGVITLYHLDSNAFSRDDLRILEAASVQIGPAIDAALKFQEAEESAATDHLTGIPNGRALAIHLERALERADREQSSVGVLVCDLDGFKQVNDRFGHLTGDEVLRRVAKGLRAAARGSDYLARIGGDEFVIVLPGLRGDHSSQLERLRAIAVAAGQEVCGEPCLSMSVGVAIYPFDGLDTETLIAEADRRMYRLKHQSKSKAKPKSTLVHEPNMGDEPQTGSEVCLHELASVLADDQEEAGTRPAESST